MYDTGYDFLTHAAFADNEHGKICWSHLERHIERTVERIAVAHDVVALLDLL